MRKIASWIAQVSKYVAEKYRLPDDVAQRKYFLQQYYKEMETDEQLKKIAAQVKQMAKQFPLFADEWRLKDE